MMGHVQDIATLTHTRSEKRRSVSPRNIVTAHELVSRVYCAEYWWFPVEKDDQGLAQPLQADLW